ncbi:MAG: adenosylmethionine--8-amino-7-oxononanoate transaminase [Acidobacteria bacterium]|nr:adenosylmethionine--8-amino-7-oxononanoate transaminase [Acidobacteriota bacterium]
MKTVLTSTGAGLDRREEIRRWDRDHLWHPFTQMQEYLADDPLVVVAAEGHYLIDDRGRRLFDATSVLWCNLLGHRVPEIDAAVSEQLGRLAHSTLLGATHPAAAELARRLVEIAPPGLNHVFFSDNGATAVEAALKIAFQYRLLTQGKEAVEKAAYLSLDNAYHGDTLGAAAVGGVELFHDIFKPILLPTLKVPSPYCYRCPIGKTRTDCSVDCADDVEQALAREGGRVCAVILEPGVQAAAGMLLLPDGYLTRVAAACRKHGALLILDEVATGFGRTGTLFACQREGVTPDLMCVAKGLTGGYLPVSATLATDAVYNVFLGRYEEDRHFFHGHTYTGNALGCAAALATLRLLADGAVVAAVSTKEQVLRDGLAPLASHRHVGEIRQAGLMCGVELVADRHTKAWFPRGDRVAYRICLSLRDRGIFMRPLGDVLVLMPPLSSTEDELRHLAASMGTAVREHLGA